MSNYVRSEQIPDPFYQHPCAGLSLEAAFVARENNDRVSAAKIQDLTSAYVLGLGESAALAYLASHRVEEEFDSLEFDLLELRGDRP